MSKKEYPCMDLLVLILCLILGEQLIFHGTLVREAVHQALLLCVETLIPSLFCFMVLTTFLSGTGLGKLLSVPMLPISRFLRFPPIFGSILLMSLIGGYPVGVKAMSDAYTQKQITEQQLKRMALLCICPAPSFVIVAVGEKLLRNQSAGIVLYAAQMLSLLFLGLISSLTVENSTRKELYRYLQKPAKKSYSTALVEAVSFSSQTMLHMCGYVLLFSVFSALLRQLPFSEETLTLIAASLEITGGSAQLAELISVHRLSILAFFLSFGGFSVLFQLKSILKDSPISFLRLFCGRLLHGGLSAGFTALLLPHVPQALQVFQSADRPLPVGNSSTPILTGCLIGMLTIFLFSLENLPKTQNK